MSGSSLVRGAKSKQRKAQTKVLDLTATSLLTQPRSNVPITKYKMLEPSARAVLSYLPLLNYWFETGVLRVMSSSVQFKTDYCIAIIKKKLYN